MVEDGQFKTLTDMFNIFYSCVMFTTLSMPALAGGKFFSFDFYKAKNPTVVPVFWRFSGNKITPFAP